MSLSCVIQHTRDPFEGPWEDLAHLSWDGRNWQLRFFKDLPVNRQIADWCRSGILRIVEEAGQEQPSVLPPSSEEFLPLLIDRLGKLRYRCVPREEKP